MTNVSKARNLAKIREQLIVQNDLYDSLSLKLISINIYKEKKEWEDVNEKYNLCANKINFLNKQLEIVERTGKLLGDMNEYDYVIFGKHYFYD